MTSIKDILPLKKYNSNYFKAKYLKYKNKYINLKKGGSSNMDVVDAFNMFQDDEGPSDIISSREANDDGYRNIPNNSINNLRSEFDIYNYIGSPPLMFYSNGKQVSPNFLNSFLISCHGTSLTNSSFRKIKIPEFIDMYFHARNGYQCFNSVGKDNPTNFFTNDFNSIIKSFVNDTLYTEKNQNFIYWINKRSGGDVINDCYLRSENDPGMPRSVLIGMTNGYYHLIHIPSDEDCLLSTILSIIIYFIYRYFGEPQPEQKYKIFCSFCLVPDNKKLDHLIDIQKKNIYYNKLLIDYPEHSQFLGLTNIWPLYNSNFTKPF